MKELDLCQAQTVNGGKLDFGTFTDFMSGAVTIGSGFALAGATFVGAPLIAFSLAGAGGFMLGSAMYQIVME